MDDFLLTIETMKKALQRYMVAAKALQQETSRAAVASDADVELGKRTIMKYNQLLFEECRSSVSLFDATTQAALEFLSNTRSRLCGQQLSRESFVATDIPAETGSSDVTAMVTSGKRCEAKLLALQSDLAALRSTGLPTDAAYHSAMRNFRVHYAISLKCKTIIFHFDFLAEIMRDVTQISRSWREQRMKGQNDVVADVEGSTRSGANVGHNQHGDVSNPAEALHPNMAMPGIDLNLPAPEENA